MPTASEAIVGLADLEDATTQGDQFRTYVPRNPKPRRVKLKREDTLAQIALGISGHGQTVIGGVDLSALTYGVRIESFVGQVTAITVFTRAIPVELEALGVVEIASDGLLQED